MSLLTAAEISGSWKFFAGEFLAKINENPDFSEGKCYFFIVLRPNIQCVASQYCLGVQMWSVSCIQFLADLFLIFHNFLTENFIEKKIWIVN